MSIPLPDGDRARPRVSVVMPTRNRAGQLRSALRSLVEQQAAPPYEILVIDNGSIDDTAAVVHEWQARAPGVITYLVEPQPGASSARNRGIRAARAPIVAFIDDDVAASPTWVADIARAFDEHPEIDCLGGRIEPRWLAPPPAWLSASHWGPLALQAIPERAWEIGADHASICLATANFACRREVFDEVGLFSPHFARNEDRELQLRLWAAGKRGRYFDHIVVTADVPPERLTKAYHRQWHATTGHFLALMRYRDRIGPDDRLQPENPSALRLFGTPGFLYRELLFHVRRWIACTLRGRSNAAFRHETRVRSLASSIATRFREERPRFRGGIVGELLWFASGLATRPSRRVVQQRRLSDG